MAVIDLLQTRMKTRANVECLPIVVCFAQTTLKAMSGHRIRMSFDETAAIRQRSCIDSAARAVRQYDTIAAVI